MRQTKKMQGQARPAGRQRRTTPAAKEPWAGLVAEMAQLFASGRLDLLKVKADQAIRRWPEKSIGWKALGNLMLMQGHLRQAAQALTEAARLAPADAQVLNNLGSALLGMNNPLQAATWFRQALVCRADYPQAHNNLAIALMEEGHWSEAETSCRQALALNADFFEAHNNLGNVLKAGKRLEDAEASYRQALALRADSPETHQNLGLVLIGLKRFKEAEESFRQALVCRPDYAEALCGLGEVLLGTGKTREAVAAYRRAVACDAELIEARTGLDNALKRLVSLWHVPMMNDHMRNEAYFSALRNAVGPDQHVLEIGTGSGLLAMMSARLGARQVTTCEAVDEIAETAERIVAANNLSGSVKVIAKMSTSLEIGVDMEGRADLLVSEVLSSDFLSEGVLESIEDAKRRLLKPGGRIIPARGSIRCALFGGADIDKHLRVEEVYGFDLSAFNSLVPRQHFLNRNDLALELLSEPRDAFSFDFAGSERFADRERHTMAITASKAGRCSGIIQWLRLEMDDSVVFENHPDHNNPASGWQQCLFVMPQPVEVTPGQVLNITAAHNHNTPWFFFQE
ncbi:MAG: protein arginine N-methyltransferase [Desulfurivibrionaceae bacterium]|nr:protein arginine N-methyltransferase [Desulfurivibrionaceae bacterium]